MRTTSSTYQTLRDQIGAFYEVEVIRGNKTYDLSDLYSLKINPKLFEGDGPSIGNAFSSVCEITLKELSKNWPRMDDFTVRLRLSSADGETTSEWLSLGTFYTDQRNQEKKTGKLNITAYDGMLLTEQYWTDAIPEEDLPVAWPITSKAWLDLLEDNGLIELDSRNVIDDTVPLIGLDTTRSIRDVLKTIAAAHGANWIMTCDNKLRLVPFGNVVDGQVAIAGIAISGIAIVGTSDYELPDDIGSTDIQRKVKSIDTTPALPAITGVHLETDDGTIAEAGTDSGYTIQGMCNFSDSEGVAELCLIRTAGYIYKPFAAECAILDPAAEVGDIVIVDGASFQMMDIEWNICTWPTATISAAYEEEVDHEYQVVDEETKQYRKLSKEQGELKRSYTELKQSAEAFEIVVGQTYQTNDDAKKAKEETDRKIDDQEDRLDEFEMHYRFDANGETIGKTNSSKSIRLANDGINMMIDNEAVVIINQDEMYSPRKVSIPLSGSLKMGDFLFQPRSSGNMSLLWVGETI